MSQRSESIHNLLWHGAFQILLRTSICGSYASFKSLKHLIAALYAIFPTGEELVDILMTFVVFLLQTVITFVAFVTFTILVVVIIGPWRHGRCPCVRCDKNALFSFWQAERAFHMAEAVKAENSR